MRLAVNDTELYFDVEGAGLVPDGPAMLERPTLLLLHGGAGFDHTYLKPFLSPLADIAQLVYLDQRGQGRSGRPPLETFTFEHMAIPGAALVVIPGAAHMVFIDQPERFTAAVRAFVGGPRTPPVRECLPPCVKRALADNQQPPLAFARCAPATGPGRLERRASPSETPGDNRERTVTSHEHAC